MNWELDAFLSDGALMPDGPEHYWVGQGLRRLSRREGFCWYAPDFYLKDTSPWFQPQSLERVSKHDLLSRIALVGREQPQLKPSHVRAREDFEKVFDAIQEGIAARRWRKVVGVSFGDYTIEMRKGCVAHCLLHMLSQPENLAAYGLWNQAEGILGATPEWLFHKQGNEIRTMAVAGTQEGRIPAASLLNDAKQVWEHSIVVEDIRACLEELGTVDLGQVEVLELPLLSHLKTPIVAKLRPGVGFEHLVRCLHPTPALGSSPRGAAPEVFRTMNATHQRYRFGAPFGTVDDHDNGGCLVAIRNLQWQASSAMLAVGCGIVADSVFEDEWTELALKESAVRRSLGL